jgi:hypothetical protein
MPVKCVAKTGLCPKLTNSFLISDAINYKYEVLKCNIAPIRLMSDADMEEIFGGPHVEPTPYEDYEGSIFGKMEKILKEDSEPYQIESGEPGDKPIGLDVLN